MTIARMGGGGYGGGGGGGGWGGGGGGGAKRLPENKIWKLDDVTRHNRSYKFAAWRRGSEEKWRKATTRSVPKRYVLQIYRTAFSLEALHF